MCLNGRSKPSAFSCPLIEASMAVTFDLHLTHITHTWGEKLTSVVWFGTYTGRSLEVVIAADETCWKEIVSLVLECSTILSLFLVGPPSQMEFVDESVKLLSSIRFISVCYF